MRYGTTMELITSVDLSIDFVYEENVTYEKLQYCINRSFKIDASAFILCLQGSLIVTLNMHKYVMKENDLIVLLPHNFIKVADISPDAIISFIGFSSEIIRDVEFFKTFYKSIPLFYNSSVFSLSTAMVSFFRNSFSLWGGIHEIPEIAMDRSVIEDAMYTAFHTVICLCKQDAEATEVQKKMVFQTDHHMVDFFTRLSMQYYSSEHSVSFYADKMGVSVSNLCRVIKKRISKTPLEIISAFIILDAQTQLKTTERSVKDVANSLGFSNPTAFCRFFRKNVQMSPLEYKDGTMKK